MGFNGGGSGGTTSPLTTLADTFVGGPSGVAAREAVGTSNQVIAADSSNTATGLTYQYPIGKNYLLNPSFESGTTTGWTLGNVALTNGIPTGTPTFGSGASGTASLSIATGGGTFLAGANSLVFADSTNYVAGNFIASSAFTIDSEDAAKVMSLLHYYRPGGNTVNSGTSSGTFGIALWDSTNSAFILPPNPWSPYNTGGGAVGKVQTTFQLSANGTGYRLVLYIATATVGAGSVTLDDFSFGPVPANTAAPSISALITGVIGATSANTVIKIPTVVFDTTASFSVSTGQYTASVSGVFQISGFISTSSVANGTPMQIYKNNTLYDNCGYFGASNVGTVSGSVQCNAGDVIDIRANQAITGTATVGSSLSITCFSNQTVAPANPYVTSSAYLNANATTTHPIIFNGLINDTTGSYSISTGLYTCPVSGYYIVSGAVGSTGSGGIFLYKNGSALVFVTGPPAATCAGFASPAVLCNAGDTLSLGSSGSSTFLGGAQGANNICTVSFTLVANAASASTNNVSVGFRAFSSSTTITSSLATVVYSSKSWDTTNSYSNSTGVWTCTISGKYQVNASIAMTGTFVLNSILDLQVQQTGSSTQISEAKSFSGGAVTQMNTNVGDIFQCQPGDTLKVQVSNSGTTPVIAATTTQNWFSVSRVGN